MEMFEVALRNKLRFNHKGLCTTEELFDLSLPELDTIFKNLNRKLKDQKEESLLEIKTEEDKILELKIDIIKCIVESKKEKKRIKENELSIKMNNQKIASIIHRKENRALEDMSIEDLKKLYQ